MKPAPFKYHRAETIKDATDMLATLENARPLSGGQSLMAMMNLRYVMVDHLIDLNPVSDLAGIRIEGDRVHLGGMTRQRAVLESDEIAARAPVITEALGFVGHVQTRNRGTVGGSLAHMDPAAELMGIAALFDAEITLSSTRGERTVPIAEYPLGYMTPNIEPDEILTGVSFDLWPAGHGYDFREFAQRHGDFAIVGVGSQLTLDQSGKIDRAAVVTFESAAAGVAEELFGEAADDKILASEERLFELGDVVDLLAVRERRRRVDVPPGSRIFFSPTANGVEVFKGEAHRVDFAVTIVARGHFAMGGELLTDGFVAPQIGGEWFDVGRWWSRWRAENILQYPHATHYR